MKLFAVVVTYHPDLKSLSRLVNYLMVGGAQVVIVDNSPVESFFDLGSLINKVEFIKMGGNAGIAAAQNKGIRTSLAQGAEIIAFFDQDSAPDAGLLPSLVAALGIPPRGVVAPICVDMRNGKEYPPYRFNRWGWARRVPALGLSGPLMVDMTISSGCMVAVEVFSRVGLMNEDFFIDFVDLEWCIRCCHAGVPIQVIPSVTMRHSIGTQVVKNGPLTTFVHSPVRNYYRLRNALLLVRMPQVPRLYALHQILAAFIHHLLQCQYSDDVRSHLRMGFLGLVDGLRGIGGKFELPRRIRH